MPVPTYPPPGSVPPPARGSGAADRPFLDVPGASPAAKGTAGLWLLFAGVGYLVGQVVASAFVMAAAAADGRLHELSALAREAQPPEWYIGVSLVGLWVGFFAGPFIASKAQGIGRLVADFGLRFKPADLLGILIGVGGQFLIALFYIPFHIKNLTAPAQKLTGASHGWGFLAIAVLTVVGAPFFEELFFRGLLFRALARLFTPGSGRATGPAAGPAGRGTAARATGVVLAVVVDGLLFGLAHWELYQFAGLAVFGMVLAWVSYRTGRLGMNMVAHASFNLVAVLALLSSRGGVILH